MNLRDGGSLALYRRSYPPRMAETTIRGRPTPLAKRNEISGWDADVLRARVTAPALEGRANDALVRLLSNALGVPRRDLEIASGTRSREKAVRVAGVSDQELRARLSG